VILNPLKWRASLAHHGASFYQYLQSEFDFANPQNTR
jgi:hypothetical protein